MVTIQQARARKFWRVIRDDRQHAHSPEPFIEETWTQGEIAKFFEHLKQLGARQHPWRAGLWEYPLPMPTVS